MNDVSRLEAQLDAADVKPKSKLSQRPNDKKPDQNHPSIHNQKENRVTVKQLGDVIQQIKLKLLHKKLVPTAMHKLFFEPYVA